MSRAVEGMGEVTLILMAIDADFAAKHDVLKDIVEQHNRDQETDEDNHKDQGTRRCCGLINGDLVGDGVGKED